MKKIYILTGLFLAISVVTFSQTLTELVVPKYIGTKTAGSTNDARTPWAVCLRIDGLVPNTSYDIRGGIGLVTDPATSYGAGNMWTGTDYTGNIWNNVFTTNAGGSSGPFWLYFQPTGNATRFDGGQQHNLRISYRINGGSMPGTPSFVGTKLITCLDIAVTPRTPATTDDGCFVKGSAMPSAGGKYVLLFDNVSGTGDPLYSYMIRQSIPTQSFSQPQLPTLINDVYMQSGTSNIGDYPAVIPIGANNPSGVRRIEARNADNTIYAFNTDTDGIWPSGGNTTNPQRRDVVIITNTDAPLVPVILPATVTTNAVTNINFNSATGGGNVTGDGGGTISARGLCWSTAHTPTVSGSHTTEPGTLGPFTSVMTGLNPNTTYYVRAYATNAAGTSYGAEVSFVTLCEPYLPATNFWASNTNIMPGQSINFFDSTMYCPTSWNWSFVGGTPMTSTLQNPTGITYNYPGVYNVCLTTTNLQGTTTNCKMGYITVNGPLNAGLVITEIMYNPPESGTDSLEFIELFNNDDSSINLQNFYFSEGVVFTFPNYTMDPYSYVLVSKSASAMYHTFGVPTLQWTSGALSNSGELIRLKDKYNVTVDSVNYKNIPPWDTLANGQGPSLEFCDPNANNALGENWRHALEFAAINGAGDSIWASPRSGCSYIPVADFSADDTLILEGDVVHFSDLSTGDITYWNWIFEGGNPGTFNGEFPPPIHYDVMGDYNVSLTVINNAGQTTELKSDYISVGTTGVKNPLNIDGLGISPNPTDGKFKVLFPSVSDYMIRIHSPIGQQIDQKAAGTNFAEIDLSGHPRGIYFIRVLQQSTGKQYSGKVILQ